VADVTFSDCSSAPVPKFLSRIQVRNIFIFENPTPVQTPATIDATEIKQCLYLINDIYKDHADCCYCRKKWLWVQLFKTSKFFYSGFRHEQKNTEFYWIWLQIQSYLYHVVLHGYLCNVQLLKAFKGRQIYALPCTEPRLSILSKNKHAQSLHWLQSTCYWMLLLSVIISALYMKNNCHTEEVVQSVGYAPFICFSIRPHAWKSWEPPALKQELYSKSITGNVWAITCLCLHCY